MKAWPYPQVFAHRGGGTLAPENTLVAMRLAQQLHYRAVEFDVMLSADQAPILMHDPYFGRTVQGTGVIAEKKLSDLITFDVGSWHSEQFRGEPIPQLADVLRFCTEHGIAMNIEIKPSPGREVETGEAVARQVQWAIEQFEVLANPSMRPLISSFSIEALEQFIKTMGDLRPAVHCGLLLDRTPPDWFAEVRRLGCDAIHCNFRLLNAAITRTLKNEGYWLFCYTVNDTAVGAELLSWGVDAFCTDRLDLFDPN